MERTITLTEAEVHFVMNELARRDPVIGMLVAKMQALGPAAEPAPENPVGAAEKEFTAEMQAAPGPYVHIDGRTYV